jgi:hypothetical protein
MEEVATMKLNPTQRPSLLPVAACAPSASWLPSVTPVVTLAAAPAPASRVHQVQIQAELAQALVRIDGSYGITGFAGGNGLSVDSKRMTDASGAPPRGRPV